MRRSDYMDEMQAFSKVIAQRIEVTIRRRMNEIHFEKNVEDDLRQSLDLIVSNRLRSPLQKPYIYFLCARTLGVEIDERDYDCAAAVELLNIATYQENTAIDSKFRTLTHLQKSRQYICAAMTREWLNELLDRACVNSNSRTLRDIVSNIYSTINAGQVLDLNLTVDELELSEEEYLDRYLHRCELLSGVFNSKLGTIASLIHRNKGNPNLEAGLKAFGIGLQITNDLGDNIIFDSNNLSKRSYQLPFSDLRNGRITYPLFVFLRETKYNKRFIPINGKKLDGEFVADFASFFIKSSAVQRTRKLVSSFYRKATKRFREIERSKSRDKLITLASILLWNKYYTEVRLRRASSDAL